MVKLIYSSAFDSAVDVAMRIIQDPAVLTKSASTIFGCDYSQLAPDKDHVGIHLTALGAFERYGSNRNGDSFPKQACIDYHDTFVKHGSVFQHHRNKDRAKALGNIKASAWNPTMSRIELFVHAHREKCAEWLGRLEKDGEVPFSMACKVAFDRCNICNTIRKNGADPNQCDHIRYELGKVYDDGKVACTHNDQPDFFDISFVGRPADRIAWNLKVAAGEKLDSVKLAEAEGLWVPDYMAIESADGLAKLAHLRRIAELQDMFAGWASGASNVKTASARYFMELAKAADAKLADADIERLRQYEPADVFTAMAKAGAVLDVRSFFKYALGPQYSEIEPIVGDVAAAVPRVMRDAVKAGDCQRMCNDTAFDGASPYRSLSLRIPADLYTKVAEASFVGRVVDERVISATLDRKIVKIAVDTDAGIGFNTHGTVGLAEKYAAYKLAAVKAVLEFHKDTDVDSVLALAAAQNLIA